MGLRLTICHNLSGTWSVHGLSPLPVSHLPSLSASLDYARDECGASPATIELVIDGFYAVVYQENGWPRRLVAPETPQPLPDVSEAGFSGTPTMRRFLTWLKVRPDRRRSGSSIGARPRHG
jgi:hypothetical protein